MSLPDVVSREQWLEARLALLAREKEFTRQGDALNADRRRLPMVRIDKEYTFEGPDGPVTLAGTRPSRADPITPAGFIQYPHGVYPIPHRGLPGRPLALVILPAPLPDMRTV